MLQKFGVTAEALPKQAAEAVQNRVLIMDGDGACYAATYDSKKLETAVRRFQTNVYEKLVLTQAETARVHITPKGCIKNYRDWLLPEKPYQGNRVNKEKPPLLEVLRSILASHFQDHDTLRVYAHMDVEADDAIMRDCYSIPNTVMYSEDKDLQIVPTLRFNNSTGNIERIPDRFGRIAMDNSKSSPKIVGHGTKFFWAQMLMGDQADNVKGVKLYNGKLCGVAATYRLLDQVRTEDDAANLVLDGYRAIGQNVLAEAECLWLTRVVGDSAQRYIRELSLSPANAAFLDECTQQKWYMDQAEKSEWDEIYSECTSVAEVQKRWEAFKRKVCH